MIPLPMFDPCRNPLNVLLNLIRLVAPQLDHNLLLVRVPRLLEQDLHYLHVQVFLQLRLAVASCFQPIIKRGAIAADHNDQIDEGRGEEVASVPVDDLAAGFEVRFDRI